MENEHLDLRSEEVQDILTKMPNWMLRWGNVIILVTLLLLFVFSWYLRYPEIVKATITVTTLTPPEKVLARSSGRIEAILVKDREKVHVNTPLAVIENTSNYKDVLFLKSIVDTIDIQKTAFPFNLLRARQFGDVESYFALFQKEYSANQLSLSLKPYKVEGTAQNFEASQISERLQLLESQKNISETELEIQKNDFQRHEKLYAKGIIAAQELEKHKLSLLQSEKNYKILLSNISQLRSSLNNLDKDSKTTIINETKENVTLERNVLQSYYELKRALKNWELAYVLKSSLEGTVTFLQIWVENQNVENGSEIFAVIPATDRGFIGKVKAPSANSGRIQIGQEVIIRLASFPDQEFGIIKGKISKLSMTPDKNGDILIDVSLPKGLETSHHKKISFQQEMNGTADIVTEDLRLIERVFYQFRGIYNR